MSNHYQQLQIENTATQEEIKKSFYKLAHVYHPDKQSGDEQKFKAINGAYQILKDPAKRSVYDGQLSNPQAYQGQQQPFYNRAYRHYGGTTEPSVRRRGWTFF